MRLLLFTLVIVLVFALAALLVWSSIRRHRRPASRYTWLHETEFESSGVQRDTDVIFSDDDSPPLTAEQELDRLSDPSGAGHDIFRVVRKSPHPIDDPRPYVRGKHGNWGTDYSRIVPLPEVQLPPAPDEDQLN